jgi:hypothetical protein
MWRDLILLLASVQVNHLHGIQWQTSEGIDGDAEQAGVCVDVPVDVSLPQVVVHGGVIQKGQVSHVIGHLILWRVHLQQFISFEFNLLKRPQKISK